MIAFRSVHRVGAYFLDSSEAGERNFADYQVKADRLVGTLGQLTDLLSKLTQDVNDLRSELSHHITRRLLKMLSS
jgi:hypothetical protein